MRKVKEGRGEERKMKNEDRRKKNERWNIYERLMAECMNERTRVDDESISKRSINMNVR